MNHFISGILKIILLEASIGLILIDRLAGDRFKEARRAAFGVLAGLMVFAWSNYGALRGGTSLLYTVTALPLILGCWWLWRAGFTKEPTARMQAFRTWAAGVGKSLKLARPLERPLSIGLVVLIACFWVFQGVRSQSLVMVHPWEQFHFYLGAKYQKELGYFDIYKAALIADRESGQPLPVTKTRDLTTFEEVPVEQALADADAVRAKFSDERWAAFKADWIQLRALWPIGWQMVLNDHGNSNSPAWAIVAHVLASVAPLTKQNQALLGWIDMLLMLILWLFVYETFGPKVAGVGLLFFAVPPNVFDYLAGSLLRWDWLFAVGMAACFLKREKYGLAGGFFGYAVASKLFPLFFGVGLLFSAFWEWRKDKKVPAYAWPFLRSTLIAGALAVVISGAMFGPGSWLGYAKRIQVAQVEKFYTIQYSLKTVYLQFAESSADELAQGWFFPREMKQARADVDIGDHRVGFLLVRLLFTAAILLLARRAGRTEAFLLGPLLVFTWLTVNMYYWNMLGLFALGLMLRKERPPLAMLLGLHGIFMTYYVYQHTNHGMSEPYAVALLLCVLILGGAAWEWRDLRTPQPAAGPDTSKPARKTKPA